MDRVHGNVEFDALKRLINLHRNARDWRRSTAGGGPNLRLLHEMSHWLEQSTLIGQFRELVTLKCLSGTDPLSQDDRRVLIKALALKELMAPLSEGIALYLQYDYFPGDDVPTRFRFDKLVDLVTENVVFRREDSGAGARSLPDRRFEFLVSQRFSASTFEAKRRLLRTPLFSGDSHLTGYLIVKQIVATARRVAQLPLMDGRIIDGLFRSLFDSPRICSMFLEAGHDVHEFIHSVGAWLKSRIARWLDPSAIAAMNFDAEACGHTEKYASVYGFTQRQYAETYDLLQKTLFESAGNGVTASVSEFLLPRETVEDYECRRQAEIEPDGSESSPAPLQVWDLWCAIDLVKWFEGSVRLLPTESGGVEIRLPQLGRYDGEPDARLAFRAQAQQWIAFPRSETRGRIVDGMWRTEAGFFHVTWCDWEGGCVQVFHQLDENEYALGYGNVHSYYRSSFRIDRCRAAISRRLNTLADGDLTWRSSVRTAHRRWTSPFLRRFASRLFTTAPDRWTTVLDAFRSSKEANEYVALSLVLPIGYWSRETRTSMLANIDRFSGPLIELGATTKGMQRLVRQRSPYLSLPELKSRRFWWSASALF